MDCRAAFPLLDARNDGELGPAEAAEVGAHLDACAACRLESDDRLRLRRALCRLELPDPAALPLPRARVRALPAAAALLLVGLLTLALPAAVPPVVAETSAMHDRLLSGGAGEAGCCCSPSPDGSSPCLVYRRAGQLISCLVAEPGPLPASARRRAGGREVHVFRAGANVIVASAGRLWASRLSETELLRAIAASPGPESARLALDRAACGDCCERLESRARALPGVADARVDLLGLELVVTPAGDGLDLARVLDALRSAGFSVRPR